MIRRLAILAVAAASLAVPSLASAHTGSVSCTDQGIVFAYNNNFANTTTVTENVNGVTKTFTVPAHTAITDTIPAPAASVIAGASWTDGEAQGSIPFVALTCPFTPPVVAPPVEQPAPPPPAAPPVVPPVALPVAPPVALPPPAKCPKGYRLHVTHGTRLCLRSITRRPPPPKCDVGQRVKVNNGWVICRVNVPALPKIRIHKLPGVTG